MTVLTMQLGLSIWYTGHTHLCCHHIASRQRLSTSVLLLSMSSAPELSGLSCHTSSPHTADCPSPDAQYQSVPVAKSREQTLTQQADATIAHYMCVYMSLIWRSRWYIQWLYHSFRSKRTLLYCLYSNNYFLWWNKEISNQKSVKYKEMYE